MNRKVILILVAFFGLATTVFAAGPPLTPCVTAIKNPTTLKKMTELKREDYVRLDVENLKEWMRKPPKDGEVVLYINRIPFKDLKPVFVDTCENFLIFRFKKDSTNDKAWAYFYKRPRANVIKDAKVGIGWSNDCQIESAPKATVNLVIIIKAYKTWGLAGIAAFIALFSWLAYKKDILRDSSALEDTTRRPFSLSRTQFSFWTILISSSFVFLWISTGETPILSGSSLILLGISGGTSILAKIIDNNQQVGVRHQDQSTKGFFTDILSDDKGISVHRFQMLIFTIVSGIIFVNDVVTVYEMPEFDDTLLVLMGVSNGTYAGFKATENNQNVTVG